MTPLRHLVALLLVLAAPARAQPAAHDTHADSTRPWGWQLAATPLVTRATPTAGRRSLTEGYLAHPVAMLHAGTRGGALRLQAMANLEGLTLARGELTTGGFGEGYVDRRHPHSYLHELVLSGVAGAGPVSLSLSAGRGFAPFGSDDPLVRPIVKFPVNHHHAQILERLVAIGAARVGPVVAEVGVFNGDEPTAPDAEPRWERFGDSWSTRLTWRPAMTAGRDLEASVSYASVRSPEDPDRIIGLDQRKWHASLRHERSVAGATGYALLEWARTDDYADRRRAFRYGSLLAEAALCGALGTAAVRLERTERHETERLEDLFRYPVPHDDANVIGVTRWQVAVVRLGTPSRKAGVVRLAPFAEAAWLRPEDRLDRAAFDSRAFFGGRDLWLLSAGLRFQAGAAHSRMGRYGVSAASAHARDHTGCAS